MRRVIAGWLINSGVGGYVEDEERREYDGSGVFLMELLSSVHIVLDILFKESLIHAILCCSLLHPCDNGLARNCSSATDRPTHRLLTHTHTHAS